MYYALKEGFGQPLIGILIILVQVRIMVSNLQVFFLDRLQVWPIENHATHAHIVLAEVHQLVDGLVEIIFGICQIILCGTVIWQNGFLGNATERHAQILDNVTNDELAVAHGADDAHTLSPVHAAATIGVVERHDVRITHFVTRILDAFLERFHVVSLVLSLCYAATQLKIQIATTTALSAAEIRLM